MSRGSDRLVEFGYIAGWRVVRALPAPVAAGVFTRVADRMARKPGRRIQQLAENLRRVVGPTVPEAQFQELVQAAVRSYARYWLEVFRMPTRSREQLRTDFQLDGVELLTEAIEQGRGVVLGLTHSGNWDAAGAWVAANGWPIATVAERLKPEGVYERFLKFRRDLGMEILPLSGGGRSTFDTLLERLAAGYVVPLVADRDLSDGGVEVDFFGERTRMPPGPAMLALRSGAPLMIASLWYEPGVVRGRVEGPLAVPGRDAGPFGARVRLLTQRLADGFAAGIAAHPADWHMMQRVWPRVPADSVGPTRSGT